MPQSLSKPTLKNPDTQLLANIPDKLYFSIGEVATLCDLKTHVLRYWEQEFTALEPIKRRGNRRYYQRKDILLVYEIKKLLYEEGYTIEGAKTRLSTFAAKPPAETAQQSGALLKNILRELEELLTELEA
jgi:DNA-binding transcriptional MerR regulator